MREGEQEAAAPVTLGPPEHGPVGAARRVGDPGPVARPAYGLGPVARPAVAGQVVAGVPRRPPATDSAPQPMSPPIARAMHPAGGASAPTGGVAVTAARGARPREGPGTLATGRSRFGLPNLRRNVCPHFYLTGIRGAMPVQAPHLLKALARQEQTVARCQLRGGVHLEQGYVNDVCLSARFNQCVFYEDDLGS